MCKLLELLIMMAMTRANLNENSAGVAGDSGNFHAGGLP